MSVKRLFNEPGSLWENGNIESSKCKPRDELLNGEIYDTILEGRVITEKGKEHFSTIKPLGSRAASRAGPCKRSCPRR
jgi:hypothetical protein